MPWQYVLELSVHFLLPRSSASMYEPIRSMFTRPRENKYRKVHSNIILNSLKLDIAQMRIHNRMDT